MSSSTHQFVLSGSGKQRLMVRTTGRVRPDSTDSDDFHWLRTGVEVLAGQFAGSATCSIRTEDLTDFRDGLARLTDDLGATATFKTMEDQLGIEIRGDGKGAMTVRGHVSDAIDGNRLSFEFAGDRAGLPPVLQAIDAILDAYPVA